MADDSDITEVGVPIIHWPEEIWTTKDTPIRVLTPMPERVNLEDIFQPTDEDISNGILTQDDKDRESLGLSGFCENCGLKPEFCDCKPGECDCG